MTTVRRLGSVAAPALTGGLGLWLSLGRVAPLADAGRVGILPPAWLALVLPAAVAALALGLRLQPRRLAPLYLAGFLWLPWLPAPVPAAVLLWDGPLEAVTWASIAGLMAAPAIRAAARSLFPSARPLALAVFAAWLLYGLAAWRMAPVLPGGDEPHYLVITQSLLADRDMRIENNHRRRDYLAYIEGDLKPDYLRRGRDREIYSIHAPGLPALVAPMFAAGGYPAVVAALALVAALGSALVWLAAWHLTGRQAAAWLGWASAAFSAPFFFQGFTVYPDGPGAVLVMVGVYALVVPSTLASTSRVVMIGAALALLPWLHTRYALLAATLGVLLLLRLARAARPVHAMAAFLAVPLAGAAAWFGYFLLLYGTVNPAAPYGGYTQSRLSSIPGGITGLLLDQQFGILPNAPIHLAAIGGLFVVWHRHRRLAVEFVALAVPYAAAVASYHMWWGGRSTPGRFLVPLLLPAGVLVAAAWASGRLRPWRPAIAALLAVSLAISAWMAFGSRGALAYNTRDGVSRWLDRVAPLVDLPLAAPSLFRVPWTEAWMFAGAWAAACALPLALVLAVRRRRSGPPSAAAASAPSSVAVLSAAGLGVSLGSTLGWAIAGAHPIEGRPGVARVLRHAAIPGALLVRLPRLDVASPAGLTGLELRSTAQRPEGHGGPLLTAPDLPPGEYELLLASGLRIAGTVTVTVGNGAPLLSVPLDDAGGGGSEVAVPLRLPAGARVLTVSGDADAARTVDRVVIRVSRLHVARPRFGDPETYARRTAAGGGWDAWFLDDGAYVEGRGFWVRGGRSASLALTSRRARTVALASIRAGAVPVGVTVRREGWHTSVDLPRHGVREVAIPVRAGEEFIRLEIAADAGFRPSAVDPGSGDTRLLGAWVEFVDQNRTVPPK